MESKKSKVDKKPVQQMPNVPFDEALKKILSSPPQPKKVKQERKTGK
jgi:hypothetical protein